MRSLSCGALAALLLAAGCASQQQTSTPASPAPPKAATPSPAPDAPGDTTGRGFPTPRKLEELENAPVPGDIFDVDMRDVDSWELTGPFPARIEARPYEDPSPWGRLLAEEAERRAGLVLPTEAMHCVAREYGLFFLEHRGQPTRSLQTFITSRCHVTTGKVGFGLLQTTVPGVMPDEVVFRQWKSAASQTIREALVGASRTAGVWFGRRDGNAVLMVTYGLRELNVDAVDTELGRDGRLEVRGEVLTPAEEVRASVAFGLLGFSKCRSRSEVPPPRFHFTCDIDAREGPARVAVSYTPPGRFLGRVALAILARPPGDEARVYRRPSYGSPRLVSDPQTASIRFVELLNDVRKRAGVPPVTLAPTQSQTAALLAPHFFAAALGQGTAGAADIVALGLVAGWHVDGYVQSGSFASSWVAGTLDLDRLLSASLESPGGREVLLSSESDRIAVGTLVDEGAPAMASVMATYSLFSADEHDANVGAVLSQLSMERSESGLPEPEHLSELSPLAMEAASQIESGAEPRDALDGLIQKCGTVLQRPVAGWMAQVRDLEDLDFPDDFLTRPTLGVSIGIAHHQPEGEPWATYVVLVVAASQESRRL